MKLLILSRDVRYYSTRRLVEAARQLNHPVKVVNPLECILSIDRNRPSIHLGKTKLKGFDVVLPRIGNIAIEYSLAVVKHFELSGVRVVNNSKAIYLAKDKFISLQVLKSKGLPVPETIMLRKGDALKKVVKELGGLPLVLKLLRGSQGVGVTLAKRMNQLVSLVKSTWKLDHDIIIQRYIPESRGADIRILVVGGAVIAAMRRYPRRGDFRSNIHQGGYAEAIALPRLYERLAQQAAQIIGLEIAGVDIIESKRGPLIIEVNASPGFEGLEKVMASTIPYGTGQDIAQRIIKYATKTTPVPMDIGTPTKNSLKVY